MRFRSRFLSQEPSLHFSPLISAPSYTSFRVILYLNLCLPGVQTANQNFNYFNWHRPVWIMSVYAPPASLHRQSLLVWKNAFLFFLPGTFPSLLKFRLSNFSGLKYWRPTFFAFLAALFFLLFSSSLVRSTLCCFVLTILPNFQDLSFALPTSSYFVAFKILSRGLFS